MADEGLSEYSYLEELGDSDYEIADGEPVVEGWKIKDKTGATIGKVHDLLFDPASKKVRYLIADLEAKVFGVENRRVLIPIGLADLHEKDDDVYLPETTISQMAMVPDYYKGELNLEKEIATRASFGISQNDPDAINAQTFYEHDHYNERNFYGRRFTSLD